jgi:hypothetical protein
MRKIPPSEWFLSQDIGKERAAAIMGDLEELAATRGRLWFWYAYVRALISLGWRTGGAAFIFAFTFLRFMNGTVLPFLMNHRQPHLMDGSLFGAFNPHVRVITWNLSIVAAEFLIFACPFVVIRFGLRDRLARLTCALFLVALPVFTLRPWLMDISGILTALVLTASITLPRWRRPMVVLAATTLAAAAVKTACMVFVAGIYYEKFYALSAAQRTICDAACFAVAAIVFVKLHRLFSCERRSVA